MKSHRLWPLIAIIIIASVAQLAIEGGFGFFSGRVNFILIALVLLINLTDFSAVVIFGLLSGFILDIYSGMPFGIIALSLFLTLVTLEILFVNFFTNFSFYSLMLMGLLAVLAYNFIFILLVSGTYFIGWSDALPSWLYLSQVGWQILTTEILLLLIYFVGGYLSRRFKPMFLR